jgi:hypothetical protein
VRGFHLVHDGMVNPQAALRGALSLPQREHPPPVVSGHGGELGHGFYYSSPSKLRRLEGKGMRRMARALEDVARRSHSAAREEAYAAYGEEVERALARGSSHGVEGPALLDYFYLDQRLAHRSGLGQRNDRYSACSTPAFVRACFDLTPAERLELRIHRMVIARLVPRWDEIAFFTGADTPATAINYSRIWERSADADRLGEMIEAGGPWEEMFDPDRVREMWSDALAGDGSAHYERVFLRIAWRVGFEDHVRLLAERATGEPSALAPTS